MNKKTQVVLPLMKEKPGPHLLLAAWQHLLILGSTIALTWEAACPVAFEADGSEFETLLWI